MIVEQICEAHQIEKKTLTMIKIMTLYQLIHDYSIFLIQWVILLLYRALKLFLYLKLSIIIFLTNLTYLLFSLSFDCFISIISVFIKNVLYIYIK